MWRAGAGYVYGYGAEEARKYFMDLGLTEEDYKYLRYKVRIQNFIVSNPGDYHPEEVFGLKETNRKEYDEFKNSLGSALGKTLTDDEFERLWNEQFESFCVKLPDGTYQGKTDFAHMMYTIAGGCVADNALGIKSSYPPDALQSRYGLFWEDPDRRRNYVGWLGDATNLGRDLSGTSLGPDDYTADLDADNIRRRMQEQNISFMQASADYYSELKDNPQLRPQEFLANHSYNNVQQAVFDAAGVQSLKELKTKDGWSDSYDFLMSLRNEDPVIKPYSQV